MHDSSTVNDARGVLHQRNSIDQPEFLGVKLKTPKLHQLLKSTLYHMATWNPALHVSGPFGVIFLLLLHLFLLLLLLSTKNMVHEWVIGGLQAVGISWKVIVSQSSSPSLLVMTAWAQLPWAVDYNVKRARSLYKPQGHDVQLISGFNSVYCVTAPSFLCDWGYGTCWYTNTKNLVCYLFIFFIASVRFSNCVCFCNEKHEALLFTRC